MRALQGHGQAVSAQKQSKGEKRTCDSDFLEVGPATSSWPCRPRWSYRRRYPQPGQATGAHSGCTRASPSSAGRTGGQAPDIYLVQLASGPDTFRQQAKAVGLNYSERFAYKSLFNGVSVRINPNDVGKLAGIASVQQRLSGPLLHARACDGRGSGARDGDPDDRRRSRPGGRLHRQGREGRGDGHRHRRRPSRPRRRRGRGGTASVPELAGRRGWDFVGDDYNADPESPGYNPVPSPTPSRTTATVTGRTSPASSAPTGPRDRRGGEALRPT